VRKYIFADFYSTKNIIINRFIKRIIVPNKKKLPAIILSVNSSVIIEYYRQNQSIRELHLHICYRQNKPMVNPLVVICILSTELIRQRIIFICMLPTKETDGNYVGIICNYLKK